MPLVTCSVPNKIDRDREIRSVTYVDSTGKALRLQLHTVPKTYLRPSPDRGMYSSTFLPTALLNLNPPIRKQPEGVRLNQREQEKD